MEKPIGGMAAQQAQPEPAGDDTGGPQPAVDEAETQDTGAAQQASPEEQGQYDQFVGRAMELIYNQKMFPHLVEMLRGGHNDGQDPNATPADAGAAPTDPNAASGDAGGTPGPSGTSGATSGPAHGLANATAMIITRVYKAAADAGANLSPDVLFHGGTEIFGQLAEISDKAGISDYANDRDKLEGAYFLAVDTATKMLRDAGVVDEAQAKAALQQLQGMDAKGELERVFRGLDAKDQSASGAKEPPPANDNQATQGGMAPQGVN